MEVDYLSGWYLYSSITDRRGAEHRVLSSFPSSNHFQSFDSLSTALQRALYKIAALIHFKHLFFCFYSPTHPVRDSSALSVSENGVPCPHLSWNSLLSSVGDACSLGWGGTNAGSLREGLGEISKKKKFRGWGGDDRSVFDSDSSVQIPLV